ncbi:HAMP domain-containing methyl-accepting chemotaxis protein [Legionella feeleii]|uniref:Methyl-accepting chemotaxis sensory transducer n=1 Tax=Legionella feeleii TaxID=453 RepID=A0A378J2L0_9GAMM|nr:methyl-accepting chemotaxis protein [Legionella feeleii]STX38534.1 Putative methyl-accepting chemotaxis sensory transducer [Legionella feeleii]
MTGKATFSMRGKLWSGFILIITLLFLVSLFSIWGMNRILVSQKALFEQEFVDALAIKDMRSQQNASRADLLQMSIVSEKAEQEAFYHAIQERLAINNKNIEDLITRNQKRLERLSKLQQLKELRKEFNRLREEQIIPLIHAGKMEEARGLIVRAQSDINKKMDPLANEMVTMMEQNARTILSESEQNAKFTIYVLALVSLAAICTSIAMAIWLMAALRKVSRRINEGTNVLATAANEITASTTQLASSSSETAAAVSQTSSTIEEVRQTSEISAQKAKYVAEIGQKTAQISQEGQKSMEESVEAMKQIQEKMETIAERIVTLSEQSRDISEIVNTVNDLAEQSNLLAVNASIEAAKAGKHGKGFSIVAQEIRMMAQQSKQATSQVRINTRRYSKSLNHCCIVNRRRQ